MKSWNMHVGVVDDPDVRRRRQPRGDKAKAILTEGAAASGQIRQTYLEAYSPNPKVPTIKEAGNESPNALTHCIVGSHSV